MSLWLPWCTALSALRPAFSRQRTFLWFLLCIAGLSVRGDNLGVTSVIRALSLDGRHYHALLRCCHSRAIKLPVLARLWTRTVIALFGDRLERVEGRLVLLADGKKIARAGRRMPAVKSLHQQSEGNTKPAFIMGHSAQAVSVLARAGRTAFAVPLEMKIHEGVVFSNADKRTLLDRLLIMIGGLDLEERFYLVADAYYASGKIIKGLLGGGNHLISRAKSNAVAYHPPVPTSGKRGRGRPRKYGEKVRLKEVFEDPRVPATSLASPVYEESNVTLRVRTLDLLWEPSGQLTRFVFVEHPLRGRIMLICSDVTLDPVEIIRLYGLRFKIELAFKQAAHVVGSYDYHFWMMDLERTRCGGGNLYLHRADKGFRDDVRRKLHAYHVFLSMGVICQGLMHYLGTCHTEAVWRSFGSWLRTVREGVAPSELVVKMALRNTLDEFLLGGPRTHELVKFIVERQRPGTPRSWPLAA